MTSPPLGRPFFRHLRRSIPDAASHRGPQIPRSSSWSRPPRHDSSRTLYHNWTLTERRRMTWNHIPPRRGPERRGCARLPKMAIHPAASAVSRVITDPGQRSPRLVHLSDGERRGATSCTVTRACNPDCTKRRAGKSTSFIHLPMGTCATGWMCERRSLWLGHGLVSLLSLVTVVCLVMVAFVGVGDPRGPSSPRSRLRRAAAAPPAFR
ncbi:hypothetical protein L1887_56899 [Cichorium endivia]|nr:hypothetical protein L1887_56899 [Cichorium endivia]